MVCFIILHYMVIEETLSCVENIKSIEGNKKIIIVDNNSSNGSGKQLEDLYRDDYDINVILNDTNDGFARGNNIGCKFAKNKYSPEFYVVMNNDIEICQKDFINRITQIWESEHYDVLGPDIYSTTGEFHQSPKILEKITIEKAKQLQKKYWKKVNSKVVVPLRCCLKQIKILKLIYNKKRNINKHIDYQKTHYNFPLHGSCFIFSRKFVEGRKEVFFPGTFFYFESEILDFECQKEGWKVVYHPSIYVLHHQNVSTNIVYSNELKKVRFMNQQNYNSISAFLEEFDG